MSVWDSTTYKLTLARQIYEQLPFYYPKILGDFCSPYLQPKGEICPIEATHTWEEVADICEWQQEMIDEDSIEQILELVKGVTYWAIGMEGIYQLIWACHNDKFEASGQYEYRLIEERLEALKTIVCASTMITPISFDRRWDAASSIYVQESRKFEQFAEGWKYFVRSMKRKELKFKEIKQERYFKEGNRLYYGGWMGDLIVLVGSSEYTSKGLIFSKRHLDFLIGSATRISCMLDYVAREYYEEPNVQKAIVDILHMSIKDAARNRKNNADKVVQAYHKARSYMQMVLFKNEMSDTVFTALKEFQSKQLQTVMDLNVYREYFRRVPEGKWLDLLHVYKWMPPPDFDPTYAFTELYDYHMNTRPSGLDYGADNRMQDLWARVVRERKLNIATAYQRIYAQWPPSFVIAGNNPTLEEIEKWEPKNLFPYFAYGADVSAQVKDKATVQARMDDEVSGSGNVHDRNFLMWYLRHKGEINTNESAQQLLNGYLAEDNYARVAYKGEAHKPGSRLFFMAPPQQRILLGELEGNISRVASHYPASLQGMGALERTEELSRLFNVHENVDHFREPVTCYIVTFDLAKFSPRFNPAILQDLHSFWANVFGYEPIIAMGRIGSYGSILHTTSNLVMSYENQGADLEGFRGRMMTLFHADLIAAACRYAKEMGYIMDKSVAAVFIDDGAVRIYARGTGRVAKRNALKFLKCMQEIYEAAGQENHPNKTIVSTTGGELLSEVYLSGLKQRCPIKAAMRLYPDYDNLCNSLPEEFDALFATTQGAVKDSELWVVGYRRLAEACIKAIYRWGRKSFRTLQPLQFAIKMVTPKGMGGFGFPTIQAMASTTAYDATIEGLGILNSAVRAFPELAGPIYKVIKQPVVQRTPLEVFREPTRIRFKCRVLVEGRMTQKILEKLSDTRGPFAVALNLAQDEDVIKHATAVAEALLAEDSISLPVLQRAWDCTPLAYLEAIVQKFRRSDTVMNMLHPQEVTRIRIANSSDVLALLSSFTDS